MFNKMKEMGDMVKKAKEMKKQMQQVQEELKKTTVESDENGIFIKITGELEIVELRIDDALLQNKEKLTKQLIKGFNNASEKSKKYAAQQLQSISGGLNLPGF